MCTLVWVVSVFQNPAEGEYMGTNAWILHMLVICIAVLLHNLIDLRWGSSDKSPVAHENWFDQRKTLHNRDSVIESKPEVIAHGFTYSPVSIRITNFSWRTRYPLQCVLYTGSRLLAVCFSHVISAGVMRGDVLAIPPTRPPPYRPFAFVGCLNSLLSDPREKSWVPAD